ncbi:protein cycle isoform X2 [Octopus bimaculoides]|uniref:protein cycle isoform X2 n=1 Tax=Octopus bimaculoides TaxID=37653 RepID=UPI00071DE2D6|nr:protein cycle isoform X2 [Octopus bimaculoides]|eukprot:XP_014775904.1 PREDICTED: protein cycle-like isoform X3 [Octopus bimaculoides]
MGFLTLIPSFTKEMENVSFDFSIFDTYSVPEDLQPPALQASPSLASASAKGKWGAAMEQTRKRKGSLIDFESGDDDDDLCSNTDDPKKYARQNHSEIEKRRRDKMNSYITELSAMIPMCNAMNRKLDKLTVLRMAVQHMKALRGANRTHTEVSQKPAFLSDDEVKHLILGAADGFLFVVSCDRGKILYVSQSVKRTLNFSQSDLIGQSLFDILHPRDIGKIKEQLSSSDLTPRERYIDAKTMLPVRTELPQKPTQLCSGARRSFFCRMKCVNKSADVVPSAVKVEKDVEAEHSHKKRKSDRKNFCIIHCTGYLKSWPPTRMDIGGEDEVENDNELCNLSCLVAVGRTLPAFSPYNLPESGAIHMRPTEYVSRHSIDGKFTYIDHRATVILGYLPQELLGTSVYEYYHQDDISHMADIHRKVLQTKDKLETHIFQFKAKDGTFLHLWSKCFSFRNPWTKEVEYIVTTNTVVPMPKVTSSNQTAESSEQMQVDAAVESTSSNKVEETQSAGTRTGAGRIGRQIAEEVTETISNRLAFTADSSSVPGPSSIQNKHTRTKMSIPETTSSDCSSHDSSLVDSVMNEHVINEMTNPGNSGDDEAAMAVIMSLLEADAGLGGPVDFSDLPWPL